MLDTKNKLKLSLQKLFSFSDADFEDFYAIFQPVHFKKNEIIIREGARCAIVLFIASGCIRYFYHVNGNEHTAQFFFEGEFFTDLESFITGVPSNINIQALEPCEMLVLPKERLYALYEANPRIERFGRILAEKAYIGLRNRRNEFLNMDPEERYSYVLEHRPHLVQRVPQHHIASYLGIKPQSLSRIRKRLSE